MSGEGMKNVLETLQAQQDLLQKLYTELDVEREASATATNESLSMIVRLQGQKAAVEMEASQYKRIAEEKMFHAQETVDIFRDLIHQKEMHIASLEFQVQAYKFKLVSLGCKDFGENDDTYPVNMLSRTSTLPVGQPFVPRAVRRGCSLPPDFLKEGDEPITEDRVSGESNSSAETANLDLSHSKSGDFSSYWQQLKRLDERVKELSISKDLLNDDVYYNGMNCLDSSTTRMDEMNVPVCESVLDMEPNGHSKVHDIFEVPKASNGVEFADSIKTVISGAMEKNNLNQKMPVVSSSDVDQLYFKHPDVTDFELQQLNRRLKRLEDDRITVNEIDFEKDDEKLMLLKAIKDQLNSIEDEIMSRRPDKPTCLKEALLHFWMR